jgi:hypothetical protein
MAVSLECRLAILNSQIHALWTQVNELNAEYERLAGAPPSELRPRTPQESDLFNRIITAEIAMSQFVPERDRLL